MSTEAKNQAYIYEVEDRKPLPTDLEAFLPWACTQMQLDVDIVISRNLMRDYVSVVPSERGKSKGKSKVKIHSNHDLSTDLDKESSIMELDSMSPKNVLYITTVYNTTENLVELRFVKSKVIPCQVMKILALIIKFHIFLNCVTINKGLNASVLYELCKILPISNITTVCLDNNPLKEGNYYLLLEKTSSLKNVSLSRCRINDDMVGLIAEKLAHPMPASTFLLTLNLSTNCITDIGAKSIGDALRTNTKLAYLNLADNMISDKGARCILDSLKEFSLTPEELMATRRLKIEYLKERNAIIAQMHTNMLNSDIDRKGAKKKVAKLPTPAIKKGKAELQTERSNNFEQSNNVKVEALEERLKTPFKNPYSVEKIVVREGTVFCVGNNSLCYLNLAYNNLTYSSVQKLLSVLEYQNDRKPKGLVNVCIEGNLLPERCVELTKIDNILDKALVGLGKQSGLVGPQKHKVPYSKTILPR